MFNRFLQYPTKESLSKQQEIEDMQAKEKEEKKKDSKGLLLWLWRQILARFVRIIGKGQKRKLDPTGNDAEIDETSANRKLKKGRDKNGDFALKIDRFEDSISCIAVLLKKYEEFIQKDFTLIIQEANSFLRSLKSNIVNMSAKKNIQLEGRDINKFAADLEEIRQIYAKSELMVEGFIGDCQEYNKIIRSNKRTVAPAQKLNQVQSQLDKVMKQLQKGQKMVDLTNNKDYSYLSAYVQKNQALGLGSGQMIV